jgi:hypothetical protein
MLGLLYCVRATAEEAEKVCRSTIVTTDGHQVSEEGWHGSMIIQQGGVQPGGFEMMGYFM